MKKFSIPTWAALTVAALAIVACIIFWPWHISDSSDEYRTAKVEIEELAIDDTLAEFDERLIQILSKIDAMPTVAYTMTEGLPFSMTSGTYVIAVLENGDVIWLLDCIIDGGLMVGFVEAIAFIPGDEWQLELDRARKYGLRYPTPGGFRPKDFVQAMEDELKVNGNYFYTKVPRTDA